MTRSLDVSTSVSPDQPPPVRTRPETIGRPRAAGKFLQLGDQKLWVRGVTYGTFRPDERGHQYGEPRHRGRRLRAHGRARLQRRAHLHRPAALAARPGPGARPAASWSGCPGSSTSPSSTSAPRAPGHRARVREGVRACAGPSGDPRLRGRQRDSRRRSSAGTGRGGSSASSRGWPTRPSDEDPGRARHLRQLPVHRVPRAAVPRLRLLQRLPRVAGSAWTPTSRACRTSPATGRCSWARSASTAAGTARSAQAQVLDWQVRIGLRRGLRGRLRLRLDRRVAPRRPRRRRLGLRPHAPRPEAQAGARRA